MSRANYSTHAPAAIAMIGKLPGTLADRSNPVQLRRRRSDEPVMSFRADRTDDIDKVAGMVARWAIDNKSEVHNADPNVGRLYNRLADNWRPLLAIADLAGGEWPTWAREAAAAAAAAADDEGNAELLADIRDAFKAKSCDRISSKALVEYLCALEDRPWAEFGKQRKPMSQNQLAKQLKPFRISPGNVRIAEDTPKGYKLEDFRDAFERYLPPEGGLQTATPPHA